MTDSILIVGGGVAGLHAATECANAGARAIIVERGPVVGGRLAAAITEAAAIGNRAEGETVPLLDALAQNENIEIMTLSDVKGIEGRPGNFSVSIRERARLVTDACTRCKLCHAVCPVVLANDHDAGLTYRKAIYTPLAKTLPKAYVIDTDNCLNTPPNYLPCQRCVEVCDDNAIDFHLPLDTMHERQVGAVILTPGFQIKDSGHFKEMGYGVHPDVVTSAELQRLLESPGPTGGYASKPSNEDYPDSVLLVLDTPSPFALYIVASQVRQLLEQDIERVAVLVLAQVAEAKDYAQVATLAQKTGIKVYRGGMLMVEPTTENTLNVSYEDFATNRFAQDTYDMVVLCSEVGPVDGLQGLAETAGVELADDGYIAVVAEDKADPSTSRPGIFVAGCASGPKNIRDSIADAYAAATAALAQLDRRLLRTGYTPQQASGDLQQPPPLTNDELRRHIEQLLYALIDSVDNT